MIHTICTVFDIKAGIYGPPVFSPSKGTALRAFQDAINTPDKNSQLYLHPDDFILFLLGHFDDNTCQFQLTATPELVISGADAKTNQPAS